MDATSNPTADAVGADAVERARLIALARLGLTADNAPRTTFESLARLAAHICGTMGAAINIVEADRQWSAAGHPFLLPDFPREVSMCAAVLHDSDVSYTSDAATDPRWQSNPLVTGEIDAVRTYAAAPLLMPTGDVIGTVCVFDRDERELGRDQLERLRDIADQVAMMLQLHGAINDLDRAATRDHLTGLPNVALFEHSAERALAAYRRGGRAPSVLFLDLDRFKAVNDRYGHATGDELLRGVTARLLATMRGTNVLARRSGDEFLILAEDHDGVGAAELVQRVRRTFDTPFPLLCGPVEVGVSIGAATARPSDSVTTLLHRADELMYQDKHRDQSLAS